LADSTPNIPQISQSTSQPQVIANALFSDASPAPTKYALSRLKNNFPSDLRLPLVEASDASKKAVDAALSHAGLI